MGRCTKDKTICNPHCPYFSNNTKTPIEYRLDRNGVKRGTNIRLYCYYDDHVITDWYSCPKTESVERS